MSFHTAQSISQQTNILSPKIWQPRYGMVQNWDQLKLPDKMTTEKIIVLLDANDTTRESDGTLPTTAALISPTTPR